MLMPTLSIRRTNQDMTSISKSASCLHHTKKLSDQQSVNFHPIHVA